MKYKNFKEEIFPIDLFTEQTKEKHQTLFYNPQSGFLPPYASAGICNRCGACAQACPGYKALKAEIYAPRGRNQLFRMILERKIKLVNNRPEILRTAASCIMCGECMALCPAKVPAHKHMAELKRALSYKPYNIFKNLALRLSNKYSRLYFSLINLKYKIKTNQDIKALYLTSSTGLKYADKSIQIIELAKGPTGIIKSGFFMTETYLQDLRLFKDILNAVKAEYESYPGLPLITDNIEEYRLLKQAEEFGEQYKNLADNVLFITDLLKPQIINADKFKDKKVLLQNNNIFFYGDTAINRSAELFICGKNNFFVQFTQAPHSAGLLAYGMVKNGREIKAQLLKTILKLDADIIITLSAKDTAFFKRILKKSGSKIQVMHLTQAAEYFYER